MAEVATLQGWMQAMILEGASRGAREHVRGNNRLTADAQLGIYAQAYRLRLLECLRTEYPVLAALAGPTAFDLFAQGYIAAHPSHSYTLYDFGADFADYLEDVRPAGDGTPQTVEAIPAALARIERAKAEVQRARGIERDSPIVVETGFDPEMTAILGLGVGGDIGRARAWRRPDSVQLLILAFDVSETLACVERGEAPVLPVAAPSHFAVSRVRYRVECRRIEPWQYDWLAALSGETDGTPPDPRLNSWLPFAIDHGLALPVT